VKDSASIALRDAFVRLANAGQPFVTLFEHGTLSIELYAPRGIDAQTPHARDELYMIARGHGTFACAGERHDFAEGDVLFAAAGLKHRFEDFSDDFAAWVVFYGPNGGEAA